MGSSRIFSLNLNFPSSSDGQKVIVYQRNAAVEAAPLKDESVLFNPGTNKFCLLNKTMAFIWTSLEQPSSVDQIGNRIANSFAGVTETEARSDAERALSQMLELGLLVANNSGA
jgi:hypothetical protein